MTKRAVAKFKQAGGHIIVGQLAGVEHFEPLRGMLKPHRSAQVLAHRSVRVAKPKTPAYEIGPITYEKSGVWWVVSMPSFPGAYTQARSKAEATAKLLRLVADLIEAYEERTASQPTKAAKSRTTGRHAPQP
jgi:predicted RNase H-like HicB family nuclease